jgi:hypothetical protein
MNGGASSAKKPEYLEFKAAVLEFADAPSAANLARYLRASRALDGLDLRSSATPQRRRLPHAPTAGSRSRNRESAYSRTSRVTE